MMIFKRRSPFGGHAGANGKQSRQDLISNNYWSKKKKSISGHANFKGAPAVARSGAPRAAGRLNRYLFGGILAPQNLQGTVSFR
jgi:hypothetical protein